MLLLLKRIADPIFGLLAYIARAMLRELAFPLLLLIVLWPMWRLAELQDWVATLIQ